MVDSSFSASETRREPRVKLSATFVESLWGTTPMSSAWGLTPGEGAARLLPALDAIERLNSLE